MADVEPDDRPDLGNNKATTVETNLNGRGRNAYRRLYDNYYKLYWNK
jgi:hypothetical protein